MTDNKPILWNSFLVELASKNVKRHKLHFYISCGSVFLVALCTLIVRTLIGNGPMIFLKLAEAKKGQYDFMVFPISTKYEITQTMSEFVNTGNFLDYKRIKDIKDSNGKHLNVSPRK